SEPNKGSQNIIIETGHHQDQLNTRHTINVIVNNNKKERQKRYREQNRDRLKQREAERRKRIQYSQSIAGPSTSSKTNRIELNNEEIITAQSSSGSEKIQPSSIQRNDQGNELNALQKKRERQQRYREQNRDKLKQREAERRRRLQNADVITELSTSPNIEFTEIINNPTIDEIGTNFSCFLDLQIIDSVDSLQTIEDYIKSKSNFQNFLNSSEVPYICKSEPCILGVDEAGRGPVLGPMVYGVVYCPLSKNDVLKSLGCADSKALTKEKRDDILMKMLSEENAVKNVGWAAEVISPNYISNSMYRRAKRSLNEVSMNSAIGLIKKVAEMGANIKEVYVDTVGPPEKYQAKLSEIFPDYIITVAKKADSIYPIVSAASIVAKVTRDRALKVWQFHEGIDLDHTQFGSGYPGDPLTKKFIREQIDNVFGYPLLVRFSWSTAELMLQEKAVTCTFEEIEEPGSTKKSGTKSISTFFSQKNEDVKPKRKRHKFFDERCLTMDNCFE
ncbi:ribonuclease H2 subunit A-like, partial [Epargyreus clarus]|uniref:ribonuclease H2 subunit A-like n=1 Tax=Epargyreus clarus TaxID=520877 RepID=UPI003C2DC3D4